MEPTERIKQPGVDIHPEYDGEPSPVLGRQELMANRLGVLYKSLYCIAVSWCERQRLWLHFNSWDEMSHDIRNGNCGMVS